jgi:hypothetical protein
MLRFLAKAFIAIDRAIAPTVVHAAGGTPEDISQDWAQRLGASGDKIARGVAAVRVSPGTAAAAQKNVWLQNTQAAANKWASRVAAVSLASWQEAMTTKGAPRIAAGAQAAQAKFAAFMGRLLPYQQNLKGNLPARGNLDQNIARSAAWIRGMANFQNTGR